MVDIEAPSEIHGAAREVLNIGAPLLLPQLNERVEFLHSHLSSGIQLSQGQQMLLGIILSSLEDPVHIASLLGYTSSSEQLKVQDLHQTSKLMHTLLLSFSKNTVSTNFHARILNFLFVCLFSYRPYRKAHNVAKMYINQARRTKNLYCKRKFIITPYSCDHHHVFFF